MSKAASSTVRFVRRVRDGDRGAVALLFAMCASVTVGSMAMAIDAVDYALSEGRMQMALDVATLSAGANLAHFNGTPTGADLATWQADARAYYLANMPTGALGLMTPDPNITATVTGTPAGGQTVSLSASGTLKLLAPKILSTANSGTGSSGNPGSGSGSGTTSLVSATNTAIRVPDSTLELVMVLDNTGSMASAANGSSGPTKMSGLQTAANSLIGALLPSSSNKNYIGLVPFASTVNVNGALSSGGTWLSATLPSYNTTGIKASAWSGCPIEPRSGDNLSPEPYSPSDPRKFQRYYYNVPPGSLKVTTYNYGYCYTGQSQGRDRNGGQSSYSTQTVSSVPFSVGSSAIANYCSYPSAGQGTGIGTQVDQTNTSGGQTITQNTDCIGTPVTFLTQNATTLTNSVSNMTPGGSTIIPTGLLWGWRMLEPAWSQNTAGTANGWVSSDPSLPKPVDGTVANLQRVMVVLTDGQNQIGAAGTIPNDLYFNGLSGVGTNSLSAPSIIRPNGTTMANALTDASELHNGSPIDTTSGNNAGWPDDVNTFQQAVCSAIKAEGITVYAITFGSSASSSNAQTTMQNCASPGNYYHAPDNATLNSIFQQIAGDLGVLRLTQ